MNSSCSMARLEAALAGNLPDDDEGALHQHLEECEECGALLEQMAGGTAWRQEAATLLRGDELDEAIATRDEWLAVDFTVDHLEPTDEPNVLGRLGGYDVLEIIGHGGMGVVLKAFDREIEGRLVDDVTGQPVAGAEVSCAAFVNDWLEPDEIQTTVTDDDGRFRLKVSSPGIYDVWLAKYEGEAHMTALSWNPTNGRAHDCG